MRLSYRNTTRTQRGFSLVELMLALALGLLVVTGIVQLFVSNSQTYRMLNAQARMQENARFALDFISRAARSAGHYGCAPDRTNYVNGLGGEWQNITERRYDVTQVIQADADSVVFRSMREPVLRLADVLQPDGNPWVAAAAVADLGFDANDVVVLANCEQGAVFRVTGLVPRPPDAVEVEHRPAAVGSCTGSTYVGETGNAECVRSGVGTWVPYTLSNLGHSYGKDAVIGALQNVSFFVAVNADRDVCVTPEDCHLWQQVNEDAAQQLVSGVEALQIRYGVDTVPGDGDRRAGQYVDVPSAAELPNVVALRVEVTVNSGEAVDPEGNMLRRTVGQTILLRNSRPEA